MHNLSLPRWLKVISITSSLLLVVASHAAPDAVSHVTQFQTAPTLTNQALVAQVAQQYGLVLPTTNAQLPRVSQLDSNSLNTITNSKISASNWQALAAQLSSHQEKLNSAMGAHGLVSPQVQPEQVWDYQQQQDGWFYYNWDLPQYYQHLAPHPTLEQQLPTTQSPNTQLPPQPTTNNFAILTDSQMSPVPHPISTAWLKVNLPRYLELALDSPTDKHVLAYLYLQAYANQKAAIFSDKAKLVSQGNNYLDSNGVFPALSSSRQYREQLASHIRAKLFQAHNHEFGLMLLIGKDFESLSFAQIVGLLSLKYDLKFATANLYGKYIPALANYQQLLNVAQVRQLATKQQAQIFPTLFIVGKHQTQTLVAGAVDMQELESRLLGYLYQQKLISYTEFNMGRGVFGETMQQDAELAKLINQQLLQHEATNYGTSVPDAKSQLAKPSSDHGKLSE